MLASLFLVILVGSGCCSVQSNEVYLSRPQLFGPSEALIARAAEFICILQNRPKSELILLQLFKEGKRDMLLGEGTLLAGEEALIPVVVEAYYEGNLECVAKAQNNSKINPTVSNVHYLRVVEPVRNAEIIVASGTEEVFEGSPLDLHCVLSAGNHVSYKWLLNGQLVSPSVLHYDHLVINRTSSEDSGSYTCVATNQFNSTQFFTSNSSIVITVKEVVSNPDIFFTVLKEDSHSYSALVTCQSTKGTPPVTFSLYNRTEMVTNRTVADRYATFKIPLVLGSQFELLQCRANNGNQTAYSTFILLEVVPVGGPVMLHYDYDIGENYAVISLRLYCKAAKGSLPRYKWFLNKTLLHDRGSFFYVVNQPPEQSILLLSVGRSSAGTYHCEVSDSFDNTTAIMSNRLFINKEVLNRLPILVLAFVFGCFAVLLLLVLVCCWIGVLIRRKHYGQKSLLGCEMDRMSAAYEDVLDSSDFIEDASVIKAAGGGEFDQASEASVDEWPQIVKAKKTVEDEAVRSSEESHWL